MTSAAPMSPLAIASTWDLVSPAYTREIAPLFEAFATQALDLAAVPGGGRVLDVAAGPGTLSFLAAARGLSVTGLDFSPQMIDQLRARAAREGVANIEALVGDGTALPFPDASFDGAFSMFGLMFFPDRAAGFRELCRVLRPGAPAVVSSWTDLSRDPVLAAVFGKLGELLNRGGSARPAFPLTTPEECRAEMSAGGFVEVDIVEGGITSTAPSAEAFIAHMVRTNAIVALTKQSMGDAFTAIESALVAHLRESAGKGEIAATMRANLMFGRRAGAGGLSRERPCGRAACNRRAEPRSSKRRAIFSVRGTPRRKACPYLPCDSGLALSSVWFSSPPPLAARRERTRPPRRAARVR